MSHAKRCYFTTHDDRTERNLPRAGHLKAFHTQHAVAVVHQVRWVGVQWAAIRLLRDGSVSVPQQQQWLHLQFALKPGRHATVSTIKDYQEQEQVLRWSILPERLQDVRCALGPGKPCRRG